MALNIKITSPTEPGVADVAGGTIIITDNGDGTWQLTSNDTITTFRLDANKADITEIDIISEDLTELNTDDYNWHPNLGTFYECTNLETFRASKDAFKNVTWVYATWGRCSNLKEFPEVDLRKATNLNYAWLECSSLKKFPQMSFLEASHLSYTWSDCINLETFPVLIAPAATIHGRMFKGCLNLKTIKGIDTTNSTKTDKMFEGCNELIHPSADEQTAILNCTLWENEYFSPNDWNDSNPIMVNNQKI